MQPRLVHRRRRPLQTPILNRRCERDLPAARGREGRKRAMVVGGPADMSGMRLLCDAGELVGVEAAD